MGKTITIEDNNSGIKYTLAFTRDSVKRLEQTGFIADDILKKPLVMFPLLFNGAFLANHKSVKSDVTDNLFKRISNKEELFEKLVDMYTEVYESMFDDTVEEGNVTWGASE